MTHNFSDNPPTIQKLGVERKLVYAANKAVEATMSRFLNMEVYFFIVHIHVLLFLYLHIYLYFDY